MNHDLFNTYWVLIAGGFVLIAAEIFVPGGILGIAGVLALLAAMIVGFMVFGAEYGLLSMAGIFVGGMIFIYLWIKYLPRSFVGRWFTLTESGKDFKSFEERAPELTGKTGTAQTDLRPAGIALVDGRKLDVLSESGFIARGTPVKIIQVVGSRIVVRAQE